MASVLNVVQYPEEGIAIVEDTVGKYIVTRDSSNIIPLPEYIPANRQPCALLQQRDRMLT